MITIYKDIPPSMISIKKYKMYKTYTFNQYNIGTGSNDIKIFDAINTTGSFDITTPIYRPYTDPYTYDSAGYISNYNYTLANGERYLPVSESLNPNGSVKRLIYKSIKRLFYDMESVFSEKSFFNSDDIHDTVLKDSAFLFYIPPKYVGEIIDDGVFELIDSSDINNQPYGNTNPEGIHLVDSEYGKLFDINNPSRSNVCIGNISYDTGHIIITDVNYRNYFLKNLIETSSNASIQLSMTSYYITTENEYVCVASADEFNVSMNLTLFDDSEIGKEGIVSGKIKQNLISDSNFKTFVTTVGLYDDAEHLVAIAKFAKPIRKETSFDSVFVIKFDT